MTSPVCELVLAGLDAVDGLLPGADRLVDGDELLPVGEHRLDLEDADELVDTRQDVVGREDARAEAHQFRDGFPVARSLADFVRDERARLRVVELQAAVPAPTSELGSQEEMQAVDLLRAQMHVETSVLTSLRRRSDPVP